MENLVFDREEIEAGLLIKSATIGRRAGCAGARDSR